MNQQMLSAMSVIWGGVLGLIGVPLALAGGLTVLNRNSKHILAQLFPVSAQIYLGGLGIIIHELSHLVMAKIFGHKITKVRLLRAPWAVDDGALGYVNHAWKKSSWWQTSGNLYIGIAPILGCTLALSGVAWWLTPESYRLVFAGVNTLVTTGDVRTALNYWTKLSVAVTPSNLGMIALLIVISTNITLGGFDLSSADLKSSGSAAWLVVIILVAISGALAAAGLGMWFLRVVSGLVTMLITVGSWSLLWSLVVNLSLRALRVVLTK